MKRLLALVLCVALCLAMGMEGSRADTTLDSFLSDLLSGKYDDKINNIAAINVDLEFISGTWKASGNDRLFAVTIKNNSKGLTIDAVDIAIYGENAYGELMYPDDGKSGAIRYYTCDVTLKPGKRKQTGYCELEGLKSAKKIHVAFERCHIKDVGTYQFGDASITDPMERYDFWYWDIK